MATVAVKPFLGKQNCSVSVIGDCTPLRFRQLYEYIAEGDNLLCAAVVEKILTV